MIFIWKTIPPGYDDLHLTLQELRELANNGISAAKAGERLAKTLIKSMENTTIIRLKETWREYRVIDNYNGSPINYVVMPVYMENLSACLFANHNNIEMLFSTKNLIFLN